MTRSIICRACLASCLTQLLTAPLAEAGEKPYEVAGVHRLAMVIRTATREETEAAPEIVARLQAEGLDVGEILRDGSVGMGIVYCCGGSISEKTRLLFYVPDTLSVSTGDVVELVLGRPADRKKQDPGSVNRLVARHESFEDESGQCRWEPEDDALWMRVLYCDWMEERGWIYVKGLNKTWYKPGQPD